MALSLAAALKDNLNNTKSVAEDTEGNMEVVKVVVATDLIGLIDRTSRAPMIGSTGAGTSGTRRPGRQRSRRPTLSGRG